MAQVINTNIMSLNAQRNLNTTSASLASSVQRLSSGLRINSAKDDAAGLAISERFTTQIRGMEVAARNANDGISLAQTAEGALAEIGNNLQRIRELAVQSRNATNTNNDRDALDAEVQQLKAEILRVAEHTDFNGTKLLDGSFTDKEFQIGANQGQIIAVKEIVNAKTSQLGEWETPGTPAVEEVKDKDGNVTTPGVAAVKGEKKTGFADQDVKSVAGADKMILAMDAALKVVNDSRANLGAIQNRFTSVVANLNSTSENLSASRSRIRDTDYAKETSELTRTQILQQAGTAMLAQAKSMPQSVLSLLQ